MSYILHICSWYPHSDDAQNGVFIRQHIDAVSEHFEAFVICNTPNKSQAIANSDTLGLVNLNKRKSAFIKMLYAFKQLKLAKNNHGVPALIHLHVIMPLFPVALLAKILFPGSKLILSEHWTGYRKGDFQAISALKRLLIKRVCNLTHKLIVVSQALKDDIKSVGIIDSNKIQIVANPIVLNCDNAKLEIGESECVKMLSVADFNEVNKNYLGILNAFQSVTISCPNLKWYVIGDGSGKDEFLKALDKTTIKERVILLGRLPQNEVHSIMPQCQFFVNFSRFETFAMAPAEAIMSGIPSIATKCGGPEFYINQDNGLLINSEDELALSKAIIKMYKTHREYKAVELKASLPKNFSVQHFTESLLEIYNG